MPIKAITKTKTVTYHMYQTSDGREFPKKEHAKFYEGWLTIKKELDKIHCRDINGHNYYWCNTPEDYTLLVDYWRYKKPSIMHFPKCTPMDYKVEGDKFDIYGAGFYCVELMETYDGLAYLRSTLLKESE